MEKWKEKLLLNSVVVFHTGTRQLKIIWNLMRENSEDNYIPANLRRSKIWRLSILHYTPPPAAPNVNGTNTPTPPPPSLANKLP